MKIIKYLTSAALTLTLVCGPFAGFAAEQKSDAKAKAKPYPLKTCVVSDEKLGEMGKPYVFTYEGQEIKLCCKDCLKKFKNDPKKYLAKIADAEKEKK